MPRNCQMFALLFGRQKPLPVCRLHSVFSTIKDVNCNLSLSFKLIVLPLGRAPQNVFSLAAKLKTLRSKNRHVSFEAIKTSIESRKSRMIFLSMLQMIDLPKRKRHLFAIKLEIVSNRDDFTNFSGGIAEI